jgi:hypothetical protein
LLWRRVLPEDGPDRAARVAARALLGQSDVYSHSIPIGQAGEKRLSHGQGVLVIIRILWRSAARVDAGYRDGWLAERNRFSVKPDFKAPSADLSSIYIF